VDGLEKRPLGMPEGHSTIPCSLSPQIFAANTAEASVAEALVNAVGGTQKGREQEKRNHSKSTLSDGRLECVHSKRYPTTNGVTD
jgi:hypothetical protein